MRFALIVTITITTLAVAVTSSPTPILISRDDKSISGLGKRDVATSAVTGAAIVIGLCKLLQAPASEAYRRGRESVREEMEEENRAEKRSLKGWLAAGATTGLVMEDCYNDLQTAQRLDLLEDYIDLLLDRK